jgi:hypothetical protein
MAEDSSGPHRSRPETFGEQTHRGGEPESGRGGTTESSLLPVPPSPRTRRTLVTFPIIDGEGRVVTDDRRTGERRSFRKSQSFPVKEDSGAIVIHNRRRRVDRRARRTDVMADPRGAQLPKLVLDTGEALLELTADGAELKFGRSPDCDLIFFPVYVSRQHARITRRGDRFLLEDSSRNGTHLRTEGGRDVEVREGTVVLDGTGWLRLGRKVKDGAPDLIRFAVIREA